MSNKADSRVMDLIQEVQRRKAAIEKTEKASWNTNCVFPMEDDGQSQSKQVNLHTVASVDAVVKLTAHIMSKELSYKAAAQVIGAEGVTFKWGGFTAVEWMEDFKTRADKIQIANKRKELAELEARLDKIISPELRAQMEIDAITKALGN